MNSLRIRQLLGKDYKYFWSETTYIGSKYKILCDYIGYKLLKLSRDLLRIGGKRCSYCGEKQNRNTGLHMAFSRKGLRCGKLPVSCSSKP